MIFSKQNENKFISVIVTVFNNADYIDQCLDSIIEQSYKNIEIIIIDDGSNDGSAKICDLYASRDKRIKVFHIKNNGVVNARKVGIEKAKGQYVSIIDGDDWLETNMLEKLYKYIQKYDADISMCARIEETQYSSKLVCHGFEEGFYNKISLLEEIYPNMIVNKDFFSWGIFPSYWDKLFKTDLLKPYVNGVKDTIPMGNDAAGVYPCLLNANSIYISREGLYHYRQHSSSIVRKKIDAEYLRNGFKQLYESVNNELSKYDDCKNLNAQWIKYLLFLMIPRAGIIYKDLSELDYLFPFIDVKKGDKIIIYGMGLFGQNLFYYIQKTDFCEVVATVDREYENINIEGIIVEDPKKICEKEFDWVVVALSFSNAQKSVLDFLSKMIPVEKIQILNLEEAMDKKSLIAMGLVL